MALSVSAITGSDPVGAAAASTAATGSNSSAPNQEMFLQLLVAQIKNQDPLNPTDSVQFVSQLAQFSQLEQVIAIRNDIEGQTKTTSGATQGSSDGTKV